MGKSIGVAQILGRKFKELEMPEEWVKAIGQVSDPFTWLIFGRPKNGKTSFTLQFCKAMCMAGHKTYYNSMEEGESKTMQDAFKRLGFEQIPTGKFILGDRDTLEDMYEKLRKNKCKIVVIDSRDYMNLSTAQWNKLTATFPHKCFVLICWESGRKPAGKYAKDIEFRVSMVTHVREFVAHTNGRFGADLRFTIWDKPKAEETPVAPSLFNKTTETP